MATDRVDKNWQSRELDQYPTEAILGTLSHYGVKTDPEAFLELAKTLFPVAIAHEWMKGWKGTGQFSQFPVAAAEELWHRLLPGSVAPVDVALMLINLLKELDRVLGEKPDDGTRETRFKMVEGYLPKLPDSPSERRDAFEVEVMYALGDEWAEVLDSMGVVLAKAGKRTEADRFTVIEEALFPVRAGAARAMVRDAAGEKAEARADLVALGADLKRSTDERISVVDAMIDLSALPEAKKVISAVIAEVAEAKEAQRFTVLADRVVRLARLLPKEEGLALVKEFEAGILDKGAE